ncbi:DUF1810 family protein [Brevundimonas vesicularis]|uniref:DUF1810 family protein n=1 Tax=Brevundimonas vesicularis TaxID=41276 RepID=UPI0020C66481|nr:DUF1810 family protein [Brevundimonas vesicularis]
MTTALDRFVLAQDPVIETAMAELAAGRKTSHWMWFVSSPRPGRWDSLRQPPSMAWDRSRRRRPICCIPF